MGVGEARRFRKTATLHPASISVEVTVDLKGKRVSGPALDLKK
jgi:hypothetical protein